MDLYFYLVTLFSGFHIIYHTKDKTKRKNKFMQGGPICSAVIMITIVGAKYFGSLSYSYFFSAADVETEVAALIHNHLVANT